MQNLPQIGFVVGFVALFLALVVAYHELKPLIRQKVGEAQFDRIMAFADVAVRKLEQIGPLLGYDGATKKQLATIAIKQFAEFVGVDIPDEWIESIIEACVYILNVEQGKFDPKIEATVLQPAIGNIAPAEG